MIGDVSTSTELSNVLAGEPDGPICDENQDKSDDKNACSGTSEKPLPDTQPGKDRESSFIRLSIIIIILLL